MAIRPRIRFMPILGLLAVVAVGTLQPSVAAHQNPESDLVEYHEAPWPLPDLKVITDSNRDQLAVASELVDFNKSDFAGTYVDQDERVVVVAATDHGMDLATKTFRDDPTVTLRRGAFSLAAVNQLGYDLYVEFPNIGTKVFKWGIDATSMSLRIGINQRLQESDQAAIERFAETHQLDIQVYFDKDAARATKDDSRLEDDSPYAGGFRYTRRSSSTGGTTGGGCSGGFGYRGSAGTNYMLTAGHCFEMGTTLRYMWNTEGPPGCCNPKVYAGIRTGVTWNDGTGTIATADGGHHGDLAIVNVDAANRNSGDHIWWGASGGLPVTVRRVPTVGDPICINGYVSGSDCGLTVQETNLNWTYNDGDVVRNGDGATSTSAADCSQNGDSGGSVIYDHGGAETQATAEGIVSGHANQSIGCAQIFTGIEEAIQAWGGNVKFD